MAILRILFALVLVLLAPLPALAQATEPTPPLAAEPATPAANERITYIHTDALGSPIMGTDEQGNVVWREDYQPYGERFLGDAANTRRLYTGKYTETGTGLIDFGGRWYNPEIGRFYSVDPQGFEGTNPHSFNRYAYANDNPYAFVDPDGEAPQDIVKLVPAFGASLGGLAAYTQGQLTGDAALVDTSLAGMNALMGSNIEALASLAPIPGTSRVILNVVAKGTTRPDLISNPKHHPNSQSPEPRNVDKLFEQSVVDGNGVRWAKDQDGIIHRFSKESNGEVHWNGSTTGVKPIQEQNIPNEIKKMLK